MILTDYYNKETILFRLQVHILTTKLVTALVASNYNEETFFYYDSIF